MKRSIREKVKQWEIRKSMLMERSLLNRDRKRVIFNPYSIKKAKYRTKRDPSGTNSPLSKKFEQNPNRLF
jgi:hypothetical protein